MKIEELIQQGRKAIEDKEAVRTQVEEESRKKLRAKAEEIFQSVFSQDELAGIEYQIEEVNGQYYAVIWDHDPGVAIGSNGRFYRLDWIYEGFNDGIGRIAVEHPGSLAEVLARVADMGPTLERAKANREKAKKQADIEKKQRARGYCPFQSGEYCDGPSCQLWISWQGMDACSIKALALIEMRRDGFVDWSEQ